MSATEWLRNSSKGNHTQLANPVLKGMQAPVSAKIEPTIKCRICGVPCADKQECRKHILSAHSKPAPKFNNDWNVRNVPESSPQVKVEETPVAHRDCFAEYLNAESHAPKCEFDPKKAGSALRIDP